MDALVEKIPAGECLHCATIVISTMETIVGEGGPADKASIALATSKNRAIPNRRMPELAPQTAFAAKRIHAKGSWQHRSMRSTRSEEHTSELQSLRHLVCRLLLE